MIQVRYSICASKRGLFKSAKNVQNWRPWLTFCSFDSLVKLIEGFPQKFEPTLLNNGLIIWIETRNAHSFQGLFLDGVDPLIQELMLARRKLGLL